MSTLLAATALWALALVFTVSATAKLRNVRSAALTLVDFGLTSRPRAWAGAGAGIFESVLAAGLVAGALGLAPSAVPATLALLTLLAFTVLIVRSLRAGADFACQCFGASSSPISARTVVRNGALAATGVVALAGPSTISDLYLPAAPIAAVAGLLGANLIAAAIALRTVNRDPLGEDLNRWERRLYGTP